MYQFEKMNRKLLGSQVEDELMNYILQEPVEIGEKIPNEFNLAEMFGVGRSTVREAVKSLVSKGILEVRRGSGTYVISTCSLEEDPLGLARFEDKYKLALERFIEIGIVFFFSFCHFACNVQTLRNMYSSKVRIRLFLSRTGINSSG